MIGGRFVILVIWWLWMLSVTGSIEARDIDYETLSDGKRWEVGRAETYDYSPSVIKEINGETKVYTCGGGAQGDEIFLTRFDAGGRILEDSKRVVWTPDGNVSDDSVHACAPTVIKHNWLETEKYLMYYECAPKIYQSGTNRRVDTFTQICLAISDDGLEWKKFNREIYDRDGRLVEMEETTRALIKLNQKMVSKFGIRYDGERWLTSLDKFDINSYGVGHPVAMRLKDEVWVYYYDSVGDWGSRGLYRWKTVDGFNFIGQPERVEAFKSPVEIRYVEMSNWRSGGFWVALTGGFNVPAYNYSWNGEDWAWQEIDREDFYTDFLAKNYSIGGPTSGSCLAPGAMGIETDVYGVVRWTNMNIWVGEGKMGAVDGCTATNGCRCYSADEDKVRGYTWQTYKLGGKMAIIGDADNDGVTNLFDFSIWRSEYFDLGKKGEIVKDSWMTDFDKDKRVTMTDYVRWLDVCQGEGGRCRL